MSERSCLTDGHAEVRARGEQSAVSMEVSDMATALALALNLAPAVTYYRQFPREPIKAAGQFVDVSSAVLIGDDLATIMREIVAREKRGGSVVIVSHGTELALQVKVGPRAGLGVDVMRLLVLAMEGRIADADMPLRLDFDKATGAKDWRDLKKLIQDVWNLNLKRVDLRACQVGQERATMYFLQRLFNCDVCCAPKAWDVFGTINFGAPTTDEPTWNKWLKTHRQAVVQGSGTTRFAVQYEIGAAVKVDALAASNQAAQAWVGQHLPRGSYSSGPIPYHALTPDKKSLIFAGDAGYRDQLVEMPKGTAEPKIDLNSPIRP
jgi:hypothetical protein